MRVLVGEPEGFSPRALSILSDAAEVHFANLRQQDVRGAIATNDALWIKLRLRISDTDLSPGMQCRFIACPATGLDHIDTIACAERGIGIVSLKGETQFLSEVRATAEHTLALTLALLRHVPEANQSVVKGHWNREPFKGSEISGKVVGILGVGRLGSIVARYFTALGASVIGFDPREDFPTECCERVSSIESLLSSSDIVSVHVAYHQGTHHLLNARSLRSMKRGAFLVNTSRGGVVDSGALAQLIEEELIAGAALDVLEDEPKLDGHRQLLDLCRSGRVIITPHIGGNTVESTEKTQVFIATKLAKALREHGNL